VECMNAIDAACGSAREVVCQRVSKHSTQVFERMPPKEFKMEAQCLITVSVMESSTVEQPLRTALHACSRATQVVVGAGQEPDVHDQNELSSGRG
jgi:hypothetical protein